MTLDEEYTAAILAALASKIEVAKAMTAAGLDDPAKFPTASPSAIKALLDDPRWLADEEADEHLADVKARVAAAQGEG